MTEQIINIEWCPAIRQFTGQLMPDGNVVIIVKEVFIENIRNGYLKRQRREENVFFIEDENRYHNIDDLPCDRNLLFEGDIPWGMDPWTREDFDQAKILLHRL